MNSVNPSLSSKTSLSQAELIRSEPRNPDSGLLSGHSTHVSHGEFSLMESAEEITFHMAHKIEDKLHSERKIRGETPVDEITTESILAHMAQAYEADAQAKLNEIAAGILAGRTDPQLAATTFSSDRTQQYLALQYVLRRGRENAAPDDILASLLDALSELEIQHGPSIRAGINTIDAAAAFAQTPSEVTQFQATYRDVVLGEATLAKTLAMALSRFGGERIAEGLKKLIQALGLDLAAARPSVSTHRIHALLQDMYHLEVAVTILDGCRDMGARLTASARATFDPERLMHELVDISGEKWVPESRFSGLMNDHGVQTLPDSITFLKSVRRLLSDLPVQIYPDHEAREFALEAAQFALDSAIDKENP
ncbi:type III secretion system gatekeeper subunit SctW [Bordetella tumulicola]|uniref:type III secretion system gatekeeper subunit SctW n=1 Tax=Bordetella tumulicola TaxID=1649133 RepID=UPI0039F0CC3B